MADYRIHSPVRVGDTFGRLEVIAGPVQKRRANGNTYREWTCRCTCGKETPVPASYLTSGNTTSCGCRKRQALEEAWERKKLANRPHLTPGYRSWEAMRHRCSNPNASDYAYYGGRGIKICERWRSFDAFIEDMGPRPSPRHTIERNEVNGDYEPGNCRWATRLEQMSNVRSNNRLEVNGELLHLAEVARRSGVNQGTIYSRLKAGWKLDEALSLPRYGKYKRQTSSKD